MLKRLYLLKKLVLGATLFRFQQVVTFKLLSCTEDLEEVNKIFVEDGILFRKGFNQALLKCIVADEIGNVLREVHSEDYGEHKKAQGYSGRFQIRIIALI